MSQGKPAKTASDEAYENVRRIALGFPAADEKLSHGAPSFHVRGKMFLTFVDDHHGDGRVAVWCKSTLEEQRRLVASDPSRFYVPPYVGVKGWLGVRVDAAHADWIELAILVEEGWRSVAPPRVLRGEDLPPPKPLPPPSPRVTTDATVAREALARLEGICLALPDAEREKEARHATFRARKKVFAYFLDNHHGSGIIGACVKGEKRANAVLVRDEPGRFFMPEYLGARGWVGVRLDTKRVDWKDVARRIEASHAAATARPPRRARPAAAKTPKRKRSR
ncbi:MAG TPA: MmcQ/YjbR family DNA-binding protein [Polyangiaceae bacterium]|jgi:hypothetical protein|nr:MmcQ/YjbR family DNA-binding protein [Polyangiaceae bacterium]